MTLGIEEIREILTQIKEHWRAWNNNINSLIAGALSLRDDPEKLPTATYESLEELAVQNIDLGIELSTLSLVALKMKDPSEIKARWEELFNAFKQVEAKCTKLSNNPTFSSGTFKAEIDKLTVRLKRVNKHFNEVLGNLPAAQAA